MLANGSSVIVWQSYLQDGSGYGVYAQRFADDGSALGAEFRINSVTLYDQQTPSVIALSGGGFVVTWQSNAQDGSSWGVYGDSASTPPVLRWGPSSASTPRPTTPSTCRSRSRSIGGGFVIAWSAYDTAGRGWRSSPSATTGRVSRWDPNSASTPRSPAPSGHPR